MGQLGGLAIVVAFLGLIGLLMHMMWRQMRRVTAHTAATRREAAVPPPPLEAFDAETGQYRPVEGQANDELIRLGAQAERPVGIFGP
jgi:hypothetical protein